MATGVCQGLAPSNGATFADVGKMLGVTTGLTSKLQAPALVPRFQGLGVSAGLTSKLQTGALLPRLQGLGVTAGLTSKLQTAALVPRFQGLGVSAGLTSKLQTGALLPRLQGLGVTAGLTSKLQTGTGAAVSGSGCFAGLTASYRGTPAAPSSYCRADELATDGGTGAAVSGSGCFCWADEQATDGGTGAAVSGLGVTWPDILKTPALAPDLGGLGIALASLALSRCRPSEC